MIKRILTAIIVLLFAGLLVSLSADEVVAEEGLVSAIVMELSK